MFYKDGFKQKVEAGMDGSDYGQGALEDTQRGLNKQSKVLARLVSLLRDKNTLDNKEIVEMFKYLF